jgi:hypothetical protein|tara:strand:- start:2592 stop:2783 length:192 start_codon:yes stop_codon:yes gene_type:complete
MVVLFLMTLPAAHSASVVPHWPVCQCRKVICLRLKHLWTAVRHRAVRLPGKHLLDADLAALAH